MRKQIKSGDVIELTKEQKNAVEIITKGWARKHEQYIILKKELEDAHYYLWKMIEEFIPGSKDFACSIQNNSRIIVLHKKR